MFLSVNITSSKRQKIVTLTKIQLLHSSLVTPTLRSGIKFHICEKWHCATTYIHIH